MTFDAAGNVYVADRPIQNFLPGEVHVFAPDGTALRTLKDSIVAPGDIAVDRAGYVYVANYGDVYAAARYVSVFAPGSVTSSTIVYGAIAQTPTGLVLDAKDNLYVAWSGVDAVSVYGSHGARPLRTIPVPGPPFAIGILKR